MNLSGSYFDRMADKLIGSLTLFINSHAGLLQLVVFLIMGITFFYALFQGLKILRVLTPCSPKIMGRMDFLTKAERPGTPLVMISAAFFLKSRYHYSGNSPENSPPPDVFLRDAAFQYSERYLCEKFLEPVSMTANLLPPMGFIGTIFGMVIHFLNTQGGINANVTAAGIATALYTTLLALLGFTCIEILRKFCYTIGLKRIEEGLNTAAVVMSRKEADEP